VIVNRWRSRSGRRRSAAPADGASKRAVHLVQVMRGAWAAPTVSVAINGERHAMRIDDDGLIGEMQATSAEHGA
jgi:hypothetical protein